jgi:dolichol-phosphate mannosyltransferase
MAVGFYKGRKRDSMPDIQDTATLNIVIPVFNEGANIGVTLSRIAGCLGDSNVPASVTIVYDFDEDNTLPVIESLRAGFPMAIRLQKNTGKGVCEAIKQGLLASRTTFVLVTMADMSDDYEKLPLMLVKAMAGWDIVCGSRYMRGGSQHGGPLVKKTLSRLAGRRTTSPIVINSIAVQYWIRSSCRVMAALKSVLR